VRPSLSTDEGETEPTMASSVTQDSKAIISPLGVGLIHKFFEVLHCYMRVGYIVDRISIVAIYINKEEKKAYYLVFVFSDVTEL
jgi:hypothetical protein